jgi:sulfate permease, SulP family
MNSRLIKDFFGAFADAAILFPLMALLSTKVGFALERLFLSAGLAYLASGWIFKIPMPVQPLKSIVIAAIGLGATQIEIQLSGALLGLYCLLLLFFDVNKLAAKVPAALVQNIQFALGVLLIQQAISSAPNSQQLFLGIALVLFFILIATRNSFSWLGLFATVALGFSLTHQDEKFFFPSPELRWNILAGLILPQMILTLGNSVIGTVTAAQNYFSGTSQKVTARNLLLSVGLGNLLSALMGGLPYCHGAGGLTAHFKGGAQSFRMNFFIGAFLIGIAGFSWYTHYQLSFILPGFALTALLGTVGYHHLFLARALIKSPQRLIQLLMSALIIVTTKNLLWVFLWATLFEIGMKYQSSEISR